MERFLIDALKLNERDKNIRPKECPYCNQESRMIKKGFNRGKQRFQCKECQHVFTYNSPTITMYSKLERSMFQKIVLDTLACIPMKDTAAMIDLSIPAVFENRHKILCVLEELFQEESIRLGGTIEFDETYELESQTGTRHIKRKPRKRGGPSNFRGISHEQVCIVTTTDRNTHEIFKSIGFGKPTTISIQETFTGKLEEQSIAYTDGDASYRKLIKEANCDLVVLKNHASYNQVEHLNTVNSIHSFIQGQLSAFRGVASKYMNRYMSLFVWIRRFLDMDDNEKLPLLLEKLNYIHFTIPRRSLKKHNLAPTYEFI